MGFGYSYETIEIDSYEYLPTPKQPGKPNTCYKLYRNGKLHRERYTDEKGKPKKDIDWEGNDDHDLGFPHDHNWSGSHRGDAVPHT